MKEINNSGIYIIKNIIRNQIYVGSSISLNGRKLSHFNCLFRNKHRNSRLQNSYNKYGKCNFIFEVIEFCEINDLLKKEQYYIDTLNPFFNISRIAGHTLGTKRTDEQRLKMSIIQKNMPQDVKDARTERNKKNRFPKRAVELARIVNTGRIVSEETRLKSSIAKKGIRRSEETKRKLSIAHKGKILSESHKLNMSLASTKKKK